MLGMLIRKLIKVRARAFARVALSAVVLAVLAGCATGGKVKDLDAQESPEVKGPSVARLEDGRDGFVITEVPRMDAESRRDFARAVALLKDQDYDGAIRLLENVIEQAPGVTAPYIDIAIAYRNIGELEKAEKNLKVALEMFPGHPAASNEYGLLYRKIGRFAEARAIYEKTIASFPDYYPAHRNLGILCDLYLKDPACALEHYEIYSKVKPEDKQVKLWIADLSSRAGSD